MPKPKQLNRSKATEIVVDSNDMSIGVDETNEESVENPVETVEIKNDNVVIEKDIEQKPPLVKDVRIKPNTNHNCVIGGVRYNLRKGLCMNVPPEVKDILNKAGLLSPL